MDTPPLSEPVLGDEVARQLETALGRRGLLLGADALAAADAEAAELGRRLLASAIRRCYPAGQALEIEFEGEGVAARLEAALEFGAVTARLLSPATPAEPVELLCAIFNLGIGLVDGLCDGDAEAGVALLELVRRRNLIGASEEPQARGWLHAAVPRSLAADHTVAFTVGVIEAFFELLHELYPGGARMRQRQAVGRQLEAALEAERESVVRSAERSASELITYSRRTSVLPFQVIEALARGDHSPTEPTAGTLLGEAMWRIDDLVDLGEDARSGALNAILLDAAEPGDAVTALDSLFESTEIARLADQAAENLLAGLQLARPSRADQLSFLAFIQRYAGIPPAPLS